ncbi:MAG: YqhA family protein [Thermomicrobiales bacterium]
MQERPVVSERAQPPQSSARPPALAGLPADPSLLADPRDQRPYRRMSRLVGAGRIWIFLAILGVSISSVIMLIYAMLALLDTAIEAFWEHDLDVHGANHLAVELIELTDLFLLGMVLYVVALGMYQLFIDRWIAVPGWMRVENLQQLKSHLISVIVVLMAVSFLADLVQFNSGLDLLYEGAAVALVAASLSGFSWITHKTHGPDHGTPATPERHEPES